MDNSIVEEIESKVILGTTKTIDYINLVRETSIREIRLVQDENLAQLRSDPTEKEPEGRCCFLVAIGTNPDLFDVQELPHLSIFKMHTIITDFHMSLDDVKLLE